MLSPQTAAARGAFPSAGLRFNCYHGFNFTSHHLKQRNNMDKTALSLTDADDKGMEVTELRPKLVSFRVTAFHGENRAVSIGNEPWNIELTQAVELGLVATEGAVAPLLALVKFDLQATASKIGDVSEYTQFQASYEARFEYPPRVTEEKIRPRLDQEPYQYLLVSQAFPLAMTHFQRELQSMGFDARSLPIGL